MEILNFFAKIADTQGTVAGLLVMMLGGACFFIWHLLSRIKRQTDFHKVLTEELKGQYERILSEKNEEIALLRRERNEAWATRNKDLREIVEVLHKNAEFFEFFKQNIMRKD